jgi:hypothetical protein
MPQHKGSIPWNKGISSSKETRLKISLSHKGKVLSDEHKEKIGKANKGKKKPPRTKEHCEKLSEAKKKEYQNGRVSPLKKMWKENPNYFVGKNNFRWKGGISKLKIYKHYKNKEYVNWRKQVFERDNYTCQNCGGRGCMLHPHHIKSYTKYPAQRYEVDNGITLCVPCHHQTHWGH